MAAGISGENVQKIKSSIKFVNNYLGVFRQLADLAFRCNLFVKEHKKDLRSIPHAGII